MLPGPTNVPERVTRAMIEPSINHRSDDFVKLYEECVNNTKKVFSTLKVMPFVYLHPVLVLLNVQL